MVKTCPNCGLTKGADGFGVRARYEDGSIKWLSSWCRECTAEACRAWRKRKGEDPAKRRARQRRWLDSLDPETAAIRRVQGREYVRRRNGITPDRYRVEKRAALDGGATLPAAPFAAWLQYVMERDGTNKLHTAQRLEISDRTLRNVIGGATSVVELATVERALILDGTHLREVYPDWYSEAA